MDPTSGSEPPSDPNPDPRPAPPAGYQPADQPPIERERLEAAPPPSTPAPSTEDPGTDPSSASAPPPPSQSDAVPVGGQAGSGPGSTAWYSGPLPISALAPKESVGSAIGRTAIKAMTALVVLGVGLFLIPFLLVVSLAAIGGAAAGTGTEDLGTPTTLIAGEADADIKLVAVPVTGLILGEDRGAGGGGLFSPGNLTYGYTIKEELEELAEDESVDGIILEVDSPGGTIFGSKAIADGIAAYQDATGQPVIAYVSGISASGGVYSMAGADKIYADYGTLVGSIGVIFGPFTTYDQVTATDGGLLGGGVTTEGGIEVEFLTAGRSKDFGNPYRPMTDEERSVLQEGLDDAYTDFLTHVAEGRDIPADTIEQDLGALIFGEQQAVSNGLIDEIANRDETYQMAAEAAGMEDDQSFRVERLQGGTAGLLDLFAGRLMGDDTAQAETAPTLKVEPLCLGSGAILAYHGDPALLCIGG